MSKKLKLNTGGTGRKKIGSLKNTDNLKKSTNQDEYKQLPFRVRVSWLEEFDQAAENLDMSRAGFLKYLFQSYKDQQEN